MGCVGGKPNQSNQRDIGNKAPEINQQKVDSNIKNDANISSQAPNPQLNSNTQKDKNEGKTSNLPAVQNNDLTKDARNSSPSKDPLFAACPVFKAEIGDWR